MNKTKVIAAIVEKTGIEKKQVQKIFNSYVEVTKEALGRGESVHLIGFLRLTAKETPARTGRNLKTKEAIDIPAGKRIAVSISKKLKELVNRKKPAKKKK